MMSTRSVAAYGAPHGGASLAPGRVQRALGVLGIFTVVLALIVAGALLSADFLSVTNLLNTVRVVALLGIVSVGVAFVTYGGNYADLSVPAIMASSGIVAIAAQPLGFTPSLFAGMAMGLAIGGVNGVAVGYLRVNPIIWTLVTAAVVDGLIRWVYSGTQIYPDASNRAGRLFLEMYGADVAGVVPLVVVILLVFVAAGYALMHRTAFGARLKLTGAAYNVARLSGVDVSRTIALSFLVSGLAAAVGGVLLTSFNKVGAPYIGGGYEFMAITAVVLGGVTLAGGRGTIIGVLGGVLVIGLLGNVLTLMGVGGFHQKIAQGTVFILAVGAQACAVRREGRNDV